MVSFIKTPKMSFLLISYMRAVKNEEVAISLDGSSKKSQAGEGLTYSWDKVNVFASTTQGSGKKGVTQKHILKDMTGICRPGELLAIMGASGAGKTTLLNALTFRSDNALKITGKLFINGRKLNADILTKSSAFVQQEDLFIGTFTVREQLMFQANLMMDRGLTQKERVARVEEVMQELSLTKCAKTLIGVPGRIKGISGGETKRLAVACELLTNPSLLFLDEPTSGLDSFMAQSVVQAMKTSASKGKTVISTIHQPSSEVFALFDRVLLMGEGRLAYLGNTQGAMSFFKELGHVCPKTYNPADFFITTLAVEPEREEESHAFVHSTCDTFAVSSEGLAMARAVEENMQGTANGNDGSWYQMSKKSVSPYKVGWWQQFRAVLKRSVLANTREPIVLKTKVLEMIMMSLLVGVLYLDQEMTQDGVDNINGAIFLIQIEMSFTITMGVISAFCMELPIFLREHFNGMYRTDVYYLSKNIAEFSFTMVLPLIFLSISYYMIGLYAPAKNFFICLGIFILVFNAASGFGLMISCLAKDLNMALTISTPMLVPLMLLGGFYISVDSIPVYFIWIYYISWFSYGNEALIVNQWADVEEIKCPDKEMFCRNNGTDVIEQFSFNPNNLGFDCGLLIVLIIGFRLLGFLLLLNKTRRKTIKQID
ncbi:protein white-like [Eriocheir sinensis]|uniref:protein white-like n=1 Tax=Eriocheir sinensis TaxID=95602 RepID=UPI0021C701FA|nr:protein white-like [Eriocheir sinensis]